MSASFRSLPPFPPPLLTIMPLQCLIHGEVARSSQPLQLAAFLSLWLKLQYLQQTILPPTSYVPLRPMPGEAGQPDVIGYCNLARDKESD